MLKKKLKMLRQNKASGDSTIVDAQIRSCIPFEWYGTITWIDLGSNVYFLRGLYGFVHVFSPSGFS